MRTIQLMMVIVCLFTYSGHAQTIRVATLDYPPFQYEENGEIKGLAAEIVMEVFKRAGREIEIKVFPFPRALLKIKNGTSDVIFTFYYKKEREEFAEYSEETLIDQTISLFVLNDSDIVFDGDLSKLNAYRFGMVRFSYGKVFDDAVKNNVITQIDWAPEMRINMGKFVKKRFDILPSDRCVALYYYSKVAASPGSKTQIKELKPEVDRFPAFVGFSRKNKLKELRNQFDEVLRKMKADGSYKNIIETHTKSWGINLD